MVNDSCSITLRSVHSVSAVHLGVNSFSRQNILLGNAVIFLVTWRRNGTTEGDWPSVTNSVMVQIWNVFIRDWCVCSRVGEVTGLGPQCRIS